MISTLVGISLLISALIGFQSNESFRPSEETSKTYSLSERYDSNRMESSYSSQVSDWRLGRSTRYGEQYNGQTMSCGGQYSSLDTTIVAVGYEDTTEFPCGTPIELCTSKYYFTIYEATSALSRYIYFESSRNEVLGLQCINAIRRDTCPGCERSHLDLSEEGMRQLGCIDYCEIYFRASK